MPTFYTRSEQPELMDDRAIVGPELDGALRQLRVINSLLLSALPTVEGVAACWRAAGRPAQFTVIDVGAGSGDIARAVLRWGERTAVNVRIVLVDIHPQTCAAAARLWQHDPRVQVVCTNVLHLGLQQVDVTTAALFLHHFDTAMLPIVCKALAMHARHGAVINDLHRHPLAWVLIWLATRILSNNRMIRNDAPLSVLRGFTRADLQRVAAALPGLHLTARWRPFFRWLVVVRGLDRIAG